MFFWFMIYLHSAEAVWELLKKGKIRVAMKWETGAGWPELTYEEFMRLENVETKKFKIVWADQEVSENPRRWPGEKKTLFPKDWTKEDIAKAFEKAEEEIKTRNNGNLLGRLTEEEFIEYCRLGWVYNPWWDKYENLLTRFKNWQLNLEFWKFGKQFNWNVIEVNWLEIKVWWKYIYKDWKYILSEDVNTLFPKN